DLHAALSSDSFWRPHRSFLVNIHHIREVIPWFKSSFMIKMNDKKSSEIPVSRLYSWASSPTAACALRFLLRSTTTPACALGSSSLFTIAYLTLLALNSAVFPRHHPHPKTIILRDPPP